MKNTNLTLWFFLALAVVAVGSFVTNYNYAVRTESLLEASKTNSQNLLGQYGLKIAEMSQVPEMYIDDVTKVVKEAISSRYGKEGSKAVFQMIKEQNPHIDPKLYGNIQVAIESGRNDFMESQSRMVDIKRSYETELKSLWSGFWLGLAGFPRVNLNDYSGVTTENAIKAFKSGVDTPLKLR